MESVLYFRKKLHLDVWMGSGYVSRRYIRYIYEKFFWSTFEKVTGPFDKKIQNRITKIQTKILKEFVSY